MIKILGILVVFGSVLGGYVLSGGHIAAIIQPFEVLIIGGAAFGAFMQANPGNATVHIFKKSLQMFGNRINKNLYIDVLKLLYDILNKSRREGLMAIEADIEEPAASAIFSKYPAILKDAQMTDFLCDYLRIMSTGNMAPHEFEGLFDMELESMKGELNHAGHAVHRVADALPGFGIVAAVLGIVVTMAMLGQADQNELGVHVGAALVGTFLGILAAYGFVGPLASSLDHDAQMELNLYECIKATLVASASGMPPTLAVEFGRKVLYPSGRPSFSELEQAIRGG